MKSTSVFNKISWFEGYSLELMCIKIMASETEKVNSIFMVKFQLSYFTHVIIRKYLILKINWIKWFWIWASLELNPARHTKWGNVLPLKTPGISHGMFIEHLIKRRRCKTNCFYKQTFIFSQKTIINFYKYNLLNLNTIKEWNSRSNIVRKNCNKDKNLDATLMK